MRRWHALPLAALVAFVTGVVLFSAASPVTTQAQASPDFTIAIDCDTSDAAVDTSCALPSGTTSVTVNVVITNEAGGLGASDIGALNFKVVASPGAFFTPNAGADANKNANPNFADSDVGSVGTWACTPPAPDNETGENVGASTSFLSCFSSDLGTPFPDNSSIVLASVTYTTTDGLTTLDLQDAQVGDIIGVELGSCNPVAVTAATCPTTTVNIGASQAATATNTATATATATNTPIPCDQDCTATPTRTSLAYDTVTPTPGPDTPTPAVPGETPQVPPTTGPGPGQPTAPGGGTGGSGGRPGITLPDTGTGSDGVDWSQAVLLSVIALALGGLAGGAYLGAVVVARKRDQ